MNDSKYTFHDLSLLGRFSCTSQLRVIALIDFDAFYAQCEMARLGLSPSVPLAVQQWNAIIALNYPARESGLRRGASVEEARRMCPGIVLQHVATWREDERTWAYRSDFAEHMSQDKAALDPYRMRSRQCFEFIRSRLPPEPLQRVEKASIDEVFLDLSAHVHRTLLQQFPHLAEEAIDPDLRLPLPDLDEPLNWEEDHVVTAKTATTTRPDWDDMALSIGAGIVRRLRAEVLEQFHLTCSAGVGCNKMLAKLAAGWRKPNQQTVLLHRAASEFLSSQKFTEIRGLGRKLGGEIKETFGSDRVVNLLQIPLQKLQTALGNKDGLWVHDAIRGYETSAVKSRIAVQSMLSAKTFVPNVIGFDQALKWIRIFAADLMGRLNELHADYPRRPTVVAVHHHIKGRFGPTRSKQTTIPAADVIDETTLFTWAKDLLRQISDEGLTWPCASLSMSISGFHDLVVRNERITSFFSRETTSHKRQTALLLARPSGDTDHPKKRRKIDLPDAGHLEGSYDCPQCHERINESKVLEHLDWHFATDLQASTGQEVETTDSDETALASLPVLRVPV